jgi:hypothetical protein
MPTPVEILNSTCIKVDIESSLGDCPGFESPIRDDADVLTIIKVWHGDLKPPAALLGWSNLYGTGDSQPN